jgi:hypothetical protein
MFDQLFASLATGFADQFGAPFVPAKLQYQGVPIKDAGGSIVTPGVPSEVDCCAQVDSAMQSMRTSPDFLETDVTLIILGPAALDTSPKLAVLTGPSAGKTYSLRSCDRDPAGIGWLCRGRAA